MTRSMLMVAALSGAAYADASARADLELAADRGKDGIEGGIGVTAAGAASTRYATCTGGESSSVITGEAKAAIVADRGGPDVTVEQEAHARPYAFEVFQFELGDRLALDVEPELADRPDRWRRRYSEAGFDVELIGAQSIGRTRGWQLLRTRDGFDWERQRDGGSAAHRFVQTADWTIVSATWRDHGEEVSRLDPVALEAKAIGGNHSGAVLTTFYPRITGIPIGPMRLDAAVGRAETGWSQISAGSSNLDLQFGSDATPPRAAPAHHEFPSLRVFAGRARASAKLGRIDASAGVERGMYLTMDSALAVEERATATLATTVDDVRVTASGFAAHSVIWRSKTASSEHETGGGALGVDVGLPDRWRLGGQAELARTFYATLDADRAPSVDTALRVDVGLHHQIANWVPR